MSDSYQDPYADDARGELSAALQKAQDEAASLTLALMEHTEEQVQDFADRMFHDVIHAMDEIIFMVEDQELRHFYANESLGLLEDAAKERDYSEFALHVGVIFKEIQGLGSTLAPEIYEQILTRVKLASRGINSLFSLLNLERIQAGEMPLF